jgi:hypothetical protein
MPERSSSLLTSFPDFSGATSQPLNSPFMVNSRNSFVQPSPIARSALNPSELIAHPSKLTGDFQSHLLGTGREPSKAPGADYDAVNLTTEHLGSKDRPIVTSPVSGTVTKVKQNPWGNVTVVDRNGWTHTYLHNQIDAPLPSGMRHFPIAEGKAIEKGAPIGYLYNEGAKRDHVHYSVQNPEGRYVDPQNVFRSRYDGAIEGIIDSERDQWLQHEFNRKTFEPGPSMQWQDKWDSFENVG